MILTLCAIIGFLIYFIFEVVSHNKNLSKFEIRILVNGTRGKTSVTKYLVAILNANGIKTIGRSTGSEAQILYPDKNEPFIRKRGARITEVTSFLRKIVKNDKGSNKNTQYQALVMECMALSEENQRVFSKHLIKPTHVVITNSFIDHIVEIGDSKFQTVATLASSISQKSSVFATDEEYETYAKKMNANFFLVNNDKSLEVKNLISKFGNENEIQIPLHLDNLLLALEVAKSLGIKVEDAIKPALTAVGDKGLSKNIITNNGCLFIPSFSINDLKCMSDAIKESYQEDKELSVIFNNRKDREYRIYQFGKVIKENQALIKHVYCVGDYPKKVSSYLLRLIKSNTKNNNNNINNINNINNNNNININNNINNRNNDELMNSIRIEALTDEQMLKIIKEANNHQIFLGLGNIKGSGEFLVKNGANL